MGEAKPDIRHRYSDRDYLEVADFNVKFKDYFHLRHFYIMMHEWLVEEGYAPREDRNFHETFYLFRETQKTGNEMWVWWRVEKIPYGTTYYRYIIDLNLRVLRLKDVEVMHQGQKFPSNWGEVDLKVSAKLEKDYLFRWRKHWLLKHINKVFHLRIFKEELSKHRLEFYREAYRFQEAIKTYFKFKKYLPEPELQKFWPEFGLGDVK